MIRRIARAGSVVFGLLAGLIVMGVGPAGAHVTVGADKAEKGGYGTLTVRVPNEESAADTVGVKIQMPTDHPIANVSVQPKPGWSVEVTRKKLETPLETGHGAVDEVVSEIEWTGGKIGPGEFDQFLIQAGPLPTDTDELTFKAIQTYVDDAGATKDVAWIGESAPGEDEPDRPAPVLALTDPPAGGDAHADDDAAPSITATGANADADKTTAKTGDSGSSGSSLDVFAMAFGVAGLVMAIVALVLAVAARQKVTTLGDPNQRSDD